MKYLFLDTNIYLHYQWFEDVDWKSVCNLTDDFTIVVPPVVIREIDKQKDSGRDRVKTRAKQVSSKFGEIFVKDQQSKKVKVIDCNDASTDLFKGTGLNLNIQDDWVIATVLQFDCDCADKLIVSADINLLMKAKYNHIPFFQIPETLKLNDTSEFKRKEIPESTRSSKLILSFENNNDHIKFNSVRYINYNEEIAELVKCYYSIFDNNRKVLKKIGNDVIKLFDNNLEDYYNLKAYCMLLSFSVAVNNIEECTKNAQRYFFNGYRFQNMRELRFLLANVGTTPTNDYMVRLTFPNDVDLFYKDGKNLPNYFLEEHFPKRKERIFEFKSMIILYHTQSIEMKEDTGIYICASECKNFKIEYEIYDFSLAEPRKTGVLNVIVK